MFMPMHSTCNSLRLLPLLQIAPLQLPLPSHARVQVCQTRLKIAESLTAFPQLLLCKLTYSQNSLAVHKGSTVGMQNKSDLNALLFSCQYCAGTG